MNDDEIRRLLEQDVVPPGPGYWERIDADLAGIAAETEPTTVIPGEADRPRGPDGFVRGRPFRHRSMAAIAAAAALAAGAVTVAWLGFGEGRGDGGVVSSEPADSDDGTASAADGPESAPSAAEGDTEATSDTMGPGPGCTRPDGTAEEITFAPGAVSGTVSGTVGGDGVDWYLFEAAVDQPTTIEVGAPAGARFDLIDPVGEVLAEGAELADLLLPRSGDYLLCVQATAPDTAYELTLTITLVPKPGDRVPADLSWEPVTSREELPDDGGGRVISIQKLEFSGSPSPVVAGLNDAIDELVAAERAAWLRQVDEHGETTSRSQSLDITSELTLAADGLVSVRIDVYTDWYVSAYPVWWSRGLIYDSVEGSIVSIDELLTAENRLALYELIAAAVAADYDVDPELLATGSLEDASYALRPEGLEVVTGRGVFLAGPYPGSVSILSWDDLRGLVDPTAETRARGGIGESTRRPGID